MAIRKSNVEVAIRVRPMRAELNEVRMSWDITGTSLTEKSNPDSCFTFDRVYAPSSTTQQIYELSARDTIVRPVSAGYNGTVFAYGQTGSGKSFTMLGGIASPPEGIVALAFRDLFAGLEKERSKGFTVKVFAIMLEIYNEQLRDLQCAKGAAPAALTIRENEHGVYVHNAVRKQVNNAFDCLRTIDAEAQQRVVAATSMNEHSSRSHCLIRIQVEKTQSFADPVAGVSAGTESPDDEDEDGTSKLQKKIVSSLNLVDLAGSERVAKTGATGLRMVEGGHINKSLTTLTTVIQKMSEAHTAKTGGRASSVHIPFRDSKLTYLLKTAIGGNSFTAVICCITVAEQHSDESRSTLQFAQRAKTIRNEVVMNEVMDSKSRIRELELKVKELRRTAIATDLYLWARDLKIKSLKEASHDAGHAEHVSTLEALVQQLTTENDQLRDQCEHAPAARASAGQEEGFADSEEMAQLRTSKRSLEQRVKELDQDKETLLSSLAELEEVVSGMETEIDAKTAELAKQRVRIMEVEGTSELLRCEVSSLTSQVSKMNELRKTEEEAMMHRARGDELLESLTALHMEHNALQVEHNTLMEMYTKAEIERETREGMLRDEMDQLKLKAEQHRNDVMAMQSMLWRMVSVAHMASHGEPLDPVDALGAIKPHVVDQAEKSLVMFISSRSSKPPNDMLAAAGASPPVRAKVASDSEALQKRITELEAILTTKDAQRDVIIDTKLKRMQELTLRLYTTNTRLDKEIGAVAEENRRLHEFIRRDPKFYRLLKEEGEASEPVNEQLVRNRAAFEKVPSPAYYHN